MLKFRINLRVVFLIMFLLISFSLGYTEPIKKVFVRDRQICLELGDGQKIKQITNSREEKFKPSLKPLTQDEIIYHGKIERDEESSTIFTTIDVASGKVINKIPFNQTARTIERIDWLPKGLFGIEFWNRGRSSKYAIIDSKDGAIISIFFGDGFSISDDRTKIVFSRGIPGGYIPNPEFKTLEVVMSDITNLKKNSDANEHDFTANATLIYSTRGMLGTKGTHSLEADFYWAPDNENVAFIDKHGDERQLVVINVKDKEKPMIKRILLDVKIQEVKGIVWASQKRIIITDQITNWKINLTGK